MAIIRQPREFIEINVSKLAGFTPKPVRLYVVHPGYVTSKNDGDSHYITEHQLAALYGVPGYYCMLPDVAQDETVKHAVACGEIELVHLHPRYDGNYTLPEKATQ